MDQYHQRPEPNSPSQEMPGQHRKPFKKAKTVEYTGTLTPAQIRLPDDLLQALRLHAIKENTSVSKLVTACCSSEKVIHKAHVRVMDAA